MRIPLILASFALLATSGSPALAGERCRDAKGHFIKCAAKPTPAPKRCRNAAGKFAKCGTPGAKPA